MVVTLGAGIQRLALPGTAATVLHMGVVLAAAAGALGWIRANRVALDRERWCACASEKTTMRVVSVGRSGAPVDSPWPAPAFASHASDAVGDGSVLELAGR